MNKNHKIKWVLDLAGHAETFVWECIETRVTKKYWLTSEKTLTTGKYKIPLTCSIGETCFTSISVIRGKLFSDNHKILNYVHKDTNYLLYVIITLVNNIRGWDTLFYDKLKAPDLGSRSRGLNNLCGRMIFGPFEKFYHEGTIWRGPTAVISFII